VSQDVQSVDVMQNLVHPILLMGSLIRSGYDFFLGDSGKDMYATIPGGDTVRLELGVDDIVRLPHAIRTGRSKEALLVFPAARTEEAKLQSVSAISRTMKEMNGVIMHQVFNHSNRETLYYTLTNTKGFQAVWFDLLVYVWCALGKATRSGLNHVKHKQHISEGVSHPFRHHIPPDARFQRKHQKVAEASKSGRKH
jgi:hypothetical protein